LRVLTIAGAGASGNRAPEPRATGRPGMVVAG
jgi:hypothetical protein